MPEGLLPGSMRELSSGSHALHVGHRQTAQMSISRFTLVLAVPLSLLALWWVIGALAPTSPPELSGPLVATAVGSADRSAAVPRSTSSQPGVTPPSTTVPAEGATTPPGRPSTTTTTAPRPSLVPSTDAGGASPVSPPVLRADDDDGVDDSEGGDDDDGVKESDEGDHDDQDDGDHGDTAEERDRE